MSKRKQKRDQRQLVAELVRFLRTGKRESITVQEYFEITELRRHWTEEEKNLLYSGLKRTNALSVSTSHHTKEITVRDTDARSERVINVTYTRMEVALLV
ncbi:hypothetical protein [Enterococcus sp. DIV2324]|uniref:hypothetical protein n=1 Tax=Enterococcus sp. DIV2324 TaxID=2774763 RepID=UPI003F29E841